MSETVHSIARTVRPHWSHRFRVLAIGLIGAVLVWLVDGLFFGFLIFQPANSSGWDTYRWYNFEHRWRTVQAERSQRAREPLVLIVGSSIAKYSVQEHVLEPVLGERLGRSVMVRPIVHAAMMPTDLVYYTERIRDLQPDLVVYITGPADADLERYKPPWEVGPAYNQQNAFRYVARRHPMYIFYSGQFAYDHFDRLTLTEFTRLQLYANFDVLKFRDEWTEPVWFNLQSGDHPRRSYLNYQGIRIPQGTWREGHTASCMRVPATVLALNPEGTTTPSNDRAVNGADRIIDLEVTPALAAIPGFHIDFYYQHRTQSTTDGAGDYLWNPQSYRSATGVYEWRRALASGQQAESVGKLLNVPPIDRDCDAGRAPSVMRYTPEGRPRWHSITLPAVPANAQVLMRLSHVIDPLTLQPITVNGTQLIPGRGVRLSGNFGLNSESKKSRTNDYIVRRFALEDYWLGNMNDDRYRLFYETHIQPADWRAPENVSMHQLNRIRLAKYYADWHGFEQLFQLRELDRFIRRLQGAPLLIVNNPENPVAYEEYAVGSGRRPMADWYAGYLRFMHGLEEEHADVRFVDLHANLPMQSFQDPHHLTAAGMLRMAPEYARLMESMLTGSESRSNDN